MKKKIITLTLIAALSATATTAFAAPIPRESAPLNATEAQIQITENIVGDILDEVQTGKLGYTLAAGYANTKIRKAVMANQTDGNGYGILSPIAQNAIRVMRDKQLRPCLLYTSDAADEEDSVDLGGPRIIKKKKNHELQVGTITTKKEKGR